MAHHSSGWQASWVWATLAAALALLAAACCPAVRTVDGAVGAGDGVSATGYRLSQAQREIFDKHCVTDCHESASAAASLQLVKTRSYADLVNKPSQQIASQIRVMPGDPDGSYLIKKMEGSPGIVGDQMPKLLPLRPQSEIDRLRAWITRGAPND